MKTRSRFALFLAALACLGPTACAGAPPSGIWLGSPWFGIYYAPTRSAQAERVVVLPRTNATSPASGAAPAVLPGTRQ